MSLTRLIANIFFVLTQPDNIHDKAACESEAIKTSLIDNELTIRICLRHLNEIKIAINSKVGRVFDFSGATLTLENSILLLVASKFDETRYAENTYACFDVSQNITNLFCSLELTT